MTLAGRLWQGGGALGALLAMCLVSPAFAEEEEEKASRMAIAMAGTLLGAISFQMAMLYITNHSDPDIRKYSYDIINSTVSIFAAVLIFQTCNGLVEVYVLEGMTLELQAVVDMIHMLIWYTVLQLTLAWISGAIGDPPKSMDAMELNLKSIAVLLAHMTGFASINAWGAIQQLEFFRMSPWLSFSVIPISIIGQFCLQRITDSIREKVALADDGEKDEYEMKWDEETEECENDVMGLTLSFNFTQAVRFLVTGKLPNQEGVEPFGSLVNHTTTHITELFMTGVFCACGMVIIFMCTAKKDAEGEESKKASEKEEGNGELALEAGKGGEGKEEEDEESELADRMKDAVILTLSMCFAWCSFFSSKMELGRLHVLDDPMLLAMAHTMCTSAFSFVFIRLLDKLADADWTPDWVDDAIKQFIKGPLSILVGFGWEQCFDQAVESLASVMPQPHWSKCGLALFCVGIVLPAWRMYLLPMELQDGWEFGFVIDHEDRPEVWDKVQEMIAKKKERTEQRKSTAGLSPSSAITPRAEEADGYRPLAGGSEEAAAAARGDARSPSCGSGSGSGGAPAAGGAAGASQEELRAAQLEAQCLRERVKELNRQQGEAGDLRDQMARMSKDYSRLQRETAQLREKNALLTGALASAEEAATELQGVLRSRKLKTPKSGHRGDHAGSSTSARSNSCSRGAANGNGRLVTE